MIPIVIENPFTKQKKAILALLDTGADACIFPAIVPNSTGHHLKHEDVKTGVNGGIEGNQVTTWKHTFKIHLLEHQKNNIVWRTKDTLIDCVDHDRVPPLLGCKGFLQYLSIKFNYVTNRIVIEIP
jgi:hypothetical protein